MAKHHDIKILHHRAGRAIRGGELSLRLDGVLHLDFCRLAIWEGAIDHGGDLVLFDGQHAVRHEFRQLWSALHLRLELRQIWSARLFADDALCG